MPLTAAELQRRHGAMLATAPYLDLSPFRLVGALAEKRITEVDVFFISSLPRVCSIAVFIRTKSLGRETWM